MPPQNKKSGSEGLGSEDIKKEYLSNNGYLGSEKTLILQAAEIKRNSCSTRIDERI
ncbi:MAG TPA: hypothetical protein VMY43_08850 [Methanothrix sp.]|nr:hypothetical protein [Methanothrix sp.]